MRGEVYNISGYKIFTMGGASSHDKEWRREGVSWWSEELPSNDEYNKALAALDTVNWKVDIILSHCAPDSIQTALADWYEHDKLTNFLETVKQDCDYKAWFFGHYHVDQDIDDKHAAVYERLIEIGE
jgi:hypothetical protein